MLLKCYNRELIQDREKTYLTSAAAAADTSLTVASTDLAPDAASSNTWADNDYMIVGEIGSEGAEVMQVSAAVTSATSITIDREGESGGLRHDHPVGTPVYRILYNQVQFLRSASTDVATDSVQLTVINLQPDDEFTRYEDTTNSSGYGFVRFYNSTGASYSGYSDGVNYEQTGDASSRDPRTLWSIRKKLRQLLDEDNPRSKITDAMIETTVNDKQREIAHMRLWSFYETERSFSLVANQFAYDIPSTVQKVHGVRCDTQPLRYITKAEWDLLHWDTDQSTQDPYAFSVWNRQILVYPRPSTASSTTAIDDAAGITATATSVTVDDSSGFNRGDYYRFIIGTEVIFATNSTSTTFTGLLRGREGTTAAAHANDATITERDIVYSCHVEPTDLIDTQDRTNIPEPEVLALGAAIDLAPFVGKEAMIPIWDVKYQRRLADLQEKYSSKQTAQHGRIKDIQERLHPSHLSEDPNRYPSSVNT